MTTVVIEIESDDVMYLSALNMRSTWFVLVGLLIIFCQMILCSLQTKTNKKAVLRQVTARRTHDAVVKFDAYRNLQRHHVVFPAIARLSC